MEEVAVDFSILTDDKVFWPDDLPIVCLIGASFKEFSIPKARVFRRWFIYLQTIIIEKVCDDKLAVDIFGLGT